MKGIYISLKQLKFHLVSLTCTSTDNPYNNMKVIYLKCFQPENLFCAAPRLPCLIFYYWRDPATVFYVEIVVAYIRVLIIFSSVNFN